jgi:hypothetical protein
MGLLPHTLPWQLLKKQRKHESKKASIGVISKVTCTLLGHGIVAIVAIKNI